MLIKTAAVLLVAVAALAGFVVTRPSEFRVARSRTIAAPLDVVYAWVNDFHTWTQWSPWERLDPDMRRELSGSPAGVGASYAWAGNRNVGEGRMTITDATPGRSVTIRLEFMKPFAATNTAHFEFVPSGSDTVVTWAMTGTNGFLAKAMQLVMDMDTMIGGEFEKGLASLDTVTTAAATKSLDVAAATPRS